MEISDKLDTGQDFTVAFNTVTCKSRFVFRA